MEKLGITPENDSHTFGQKQTNSQGSSCTSIQRCTKYLIHAYECEHANCRLPGCLKMKRLIQRSKNCEQKANGGCNICKQLEKLSSDHASRCQELKCQVPVCGSIKHLKQKQRQLFLQQIPPLKTRIAGIRNSGMYSASPQSSPLSSNFSIQRSPGAEPHSSSHSLKPGMSMELSREPPVPAVQEVQSSASTQAPNAMCPVPTCVTKTQPGWQQLIQALKSPPSAQQQQEVLAILKSNPHLMASFIKERTQRLQGRNMIVSMSSRPPQNV